MKKLMIAAAIVCAAAMSQAATYQWNAKITESGALYDPINGSTGVSGAGYIFEAAKIDQAGLFEALFTDGTALETLASTYGAHDITLSNGQLAPTTIYTDQEYGAVQEFLLVMKYGDYIFLDDAESFAASTLPGGQDITLDVGWTQGGGYTFDPKVDGNQDGAWYAASVPEPTSGLLLLLGVAGLALRRRRA